MKAFEIVIRDENSIEEFMIKHVNMEKVEAFGLEFNVTDYYDNFDNGVISGMVFVLEQEVFNNNTQG
jgi:hypothetical protein